MCTCVYSSLSSIGLGTPPLAPADDDDRIGPESFKNDEMIFPEPAEATGAPVSSSFKSALTSSSLSGEGTGAPPLNPPKPPDEPPLKLPNPPAELPLRAPNFDVIAAIFG